MTELRGWTRPRPIRVAFLVQNGEHAPSILDNIFSDSYRRWGGRFSMVIPCENSCIPLPYWPWLEHFDPDIVYSYVELSDADAIEIHERLSPASLDIHRLQDPPRHRPEYRFQPLQSLSTIFRLARFRPGRDEPLHVLDVWQTDKPTRFLSDNFGTYMNSEGTGMYPADATPAADRLAVVSPEHQQKRQLVPQDLKVVSNELEAMKAIADRRAVSMAQLSTQFAPKLNIRNGRWSGTFNLVIGNSFADRLLFWNARLLIPAWLDPNICCLRLEPAQLESAEFLEILVHLLNHHNHVNGGAGGQAQLTIRSCSLTLDQLNAATAQLRHSRLWGATSVEVVPSPETMIPNADALSAAMEGGRQNGAFFTDAGWTQFVWSDKTARPPVDVPDHLADAPARQTFTTGLWAQEAVLELSSPGLRDENQWMLPRRWRMAGAFFVEYTGNAPHHIPPATRADRFGRLTTFVSTERPLREIKVPTLRAAFAHAFVIEGLHAAAARKNAGGVIAPAKAAWVREGNEDAYLTGVLGLAGGLDAATAYLLHPFLKSVFAELGGSPNPAGRPLENTDARLRKWANRQHPYDLKDPADRAALSNLVVRAASDLRRPKAFISFATLKEKWETFRAAYWAVNRRPERVDDDGQWEQDDRNSLEACLASLRDRQMLFQGHRWICAKCSHHNWQNFDELSAELICAVCTQETRAPIDIKWLFRPNEFLIECLGDHSTLSLIWLLDRLARDARTSFFYSGPTCFGYSRDSNAIDSEVDLLAIIDGKSHLCEAKSSWRDLRLGDIEKFQTLALRLRPDVAVLAVMQSGDGPVKPLAALRAALNQVSIAFRLIQPGQFDYHEFPYLPFSLN